MKLNPREEGGQVVDIPDYKMLRFKPDDKLKSNILLTDTPLTGSKSVNMETQDVGKE